MSSSFDKHNLRNIYDILLAEYGPQCWWPVTQAGGNVPQYRCGPRNDNQRLEVILGAILTQNTTWRQVEKALTALNRTGNLRFDRLLAIDEEEFAVLIRPSGYFRQKAARIKSLLRFIAGRYGVEDWPEMFSEELDKLREMLLALNGIGPETADSILLYAGGYPTFVVDKYTSRLLFRLGITEKMESYYNLKSMFENCLPQDSKLFNEYHALIVRHMVFRCRARNPLCEGCPLFRLCKRQGVDN